MPMIVLDLTFYVDTYTPGKFSVKSQHEQDLHWVGESSQPQHIGWY